MADEKFWNRVVVSGDCLVWTGAINAHGYGVVTRRPKHYLAHIYAWTQRDGEVPAGLELDHLCRNRLCVLVTHLEPVTHRENVLRGEGMAAIHARATECAKGHAFDKANTRVDARGWRVCVTCKRASDAASARKRYAEKRTA